MRQQAVIVDIDGTLAIRIDREPFEWERLCNDIPNVRLIQLLERLADSGLKVILVSGREEKLRSNTEEWLTEHFPGYEKLFLRPTGDFRKDFQIKREIFESEISNTFEVLAVFDDRQQTVEMWRNHLKLLCLQVAEGNF